MGALARVWFRLTALTQTLALTPTLTLLTSSLSPGLAFTQVRLSIIYRLGDLVDLVGIDCAVDGEGGAPPAYTRSRLAASPSAMWRRPPISPLLNPTAISTLGSARHVSWPIVLPVPNPPP